MSISLILSLYRRVVQDQMAFLLKPWPQLHAISKSHVSTKKSVMYITFRKSVYGRFAGADAIIFLIIFPFILGASGWFAHRWKAVVLRRILGGRKSSVSFKTRELQLIEFRKSFLISEHFYDHDDIV